VGLAFGSAPASGALSTGGAFAATGLAGGLSSTFTGAGGRGT
jgi:hypothetical protein